MTGADHRVRALHLTEGARRAAADVLSIAAAALGDLVSVLEPVDRDALEPLFEGSSPDSRGPPRGAHGLPAVRPGGLLRRRGRLPLQHTAP